MLTALGGAGAFGLAGCIGGSGGGSGSGSGKPDSIRYLGWGGNTQDSAKQLFEKWSEESGVKVQHTSAGGDSEFISRLKQNPGEFDLVNFSSYGISIARNEDLLGEIDFSKLPNYTENMQEAFQNAPYVKSDEKSDTVFRDPVTQGYTYNTDEVDQELTSWGDLLNEQFTDQVALRDDPLSRFANAALAIGTNINEIVNDDALYQKTIERMKQEHRVVFKYWGSGAQAIQLLREGNAMIAEIWGGRTLALQDAGYEQMKYVLPEEGTFVLDENYNIPKASEKSDTVHELLNWSYKRENAIELSTNLGYPIMIKDPPKEIQNMPDYVDSIDQLSWPTWNDVLPSLDQMQRDFQKVKQG
ncbi:PotD/PotF family extracellular solute-binding protein [Halomarina halobia]|uniref:PotD/PotF family extracellular solute-binding protein n=1 Tax=Halomarina halobia TaxID=3033386 RepID=A0ABD6AEK7_9EURY|nr:extracellular solute-binding protein [Halomarina sp. PSR21]